MRLTKIFLCVALLLCAWMVRGRYAATVSASSNGPAFVEFESGPVRPIAISADGNTLFAVNTPNGTLEIFDLTSGLPGLRSARSGGPGAGGRRGAQQHRGLGDESSFG